MNMKRNRKFEQEKELIRIKDEISDNWDAIRNQAWIELDKPIAHGWNAEWGLRADIERSPEGPILQYLIDEYGRSIWSRRKDFKEKEWRSKKWVDITPYFRGIDEYDYEVLDRRIKKYFVVDYKNSSLWRTRYKIYIDPWKLVLKKSRSYITHYKEHDEILEQIKAELDKELYSITPKPWGKYGNPKWWRRSQRRGAKTKHRSENIDIINTYNNGGDIDDYDSTYRTPDSHWW
jgi:hypothetical protein